MINVVANNVLLFKMFIFVILILVIILLFKITIIILKRKNHINKPILVTRSTSESIFIDLSPKSVDLIELAIEVWRIKNRLEKISSGLDDSQKRGLDSSIQKFIKYLDRFNIKIIDHTNQKYNEGLSVDVLSFENSPDVSVPIIKETVEPTILCESKVVKKGKVVVIKNN